MRSARVFYLLLSVLQFILFLKLIEFVRGEAAQVPEQTLAEKAFALNTSDTEDDSGRGLFLAPKMKRRKLRPWNGKSQDLSQNSTVPVVSVTSKTISNESESNGTIQDKKDEVSQQVGRLCPGCENNQCTVTEPISAGFPIVPVVIAIIIGIKWFILFLFVWIFYMKPQKKPQQTYGYGSQSGYGSSTSDDDSSPFGSILDKFNFLKPNQRSLQHYTQILHTALDSIDKLSEIYNGN